MKQIDPKSLTKDERRKIATLAVEKGAKVVAQEVGLPWRTIAMWRATYGPPRSPDGNHRKPAVLPAAGGSPSTTGFNNGQLPTFPAFRDDWAPETQCAWLEKYAELARK